MAVSNDGVNAFQSGDFRGSALGITTGYDNSRPRIPASDAAYESERAAVGFLSHAAGVENHDLSRIQRGGFGQSAAAETRGNGFSVSTAGPASEVLNVVCFHNIEFINPTPRDCVLAPERLTEAMDN
jgi:hypothetical protein